MGTVDYWLDGKIIQIDENDSRNHPPRTEEEQLEVEKQLEIDLGRAMRNERNGLLFESDWVVAKAIEEGTSVADNWKTYRQALRDLPTHSKWPNLKESDLPTKPS